MRCAGDSPYTNPLFGDSRTPNMAGSRPQMNPIWSPGDGPASPEQEGMAAMPPPPMDFLSADDPPLGKDPRTRVILATKVFSRGLTGACMPHTLSIAIHEKTRILTMLVTCLVCRGHPKCHTQVQAHRHLNRMHKCWAYTV